jgi:hypothetical protein
LNLPTVASLASESDEGCYWVSHALDDWRFD